jgi:predicted enzyme related to lactoylglutathione lyase
MTSELVALCVDAHDPGRLARFWSGLLGWDAVDRAGHVALLPDDDTGFEIRFLPSSRAKTVANRMHLDLTSSSAQDQQQRVARALGLGARHLDVGQRPEEDHVVLADPEGNELCVVGPGNRFLADCGLVGAVSCDGSREVGYFWSRALGWPLVWDQDEETAIRSPHGGPKISWGGPPVAPKVGRNRVHFDLRAAGGADGATEVERLVSLGASRLDAAHEGGGRVALADPDGNELFVETGSSS